MEEKELEKLKKYATAFELCKNEEDIKKTIIDICKIELSNYCNNKNSENLTNSEKYRQWLEVMYDLQLKKEEFFSSYLENVVNSKIPNAFTLYINYLNSQVNSLFEKTITKNK